MSEPQPSAPPLLQTPSTSNLIRYATPTDTPELVRIINRAYAAEVFCVTGDRTDVTDITARFAQGRFLVIDDTTDRKRLIASVFVSVKAQRGYLGLLTVDPDAQGKGLSAKLIAAVEAYCLEAGCNFIDLTVINVRENMFPFYAKFDFSPSDVIAFPAPDRQKMPLHLVQLTKALRPAARLAAPSSSASRAPTQ